MQDTLSSRNVENKKITYTHEKIVDKAAIRNGNAIKAIRTDHAATTLDKFLKKGNSTLRTDLGVKTK